MTTLRSTVNTVEIGPDQPFVVIGERINPTGKRKLANALQTGDWSYVEVEATRQVEAGAVVIDVNVGVPGIDEPRVLRQAVEVVMGVVDVPLCIDSADPEALEAALSVYQGKALVNSVTGEERILQKVLPVVKQHGAAVIGLCMNDEGIPDTVDGRVEIAERIRDAAAGYGIPDEDLLIDCLAMTVSADHLAASVTLQAIRRVSEQMGLNTVLGASNVSHGMPDRVGINQLFLGMAIACGLTSGIVDPTVREIARAVSIADLMMGRDEYAMRYIMQWRASQAAAEA